MPRELISRSRAVLFDFDGIVADSEPFFFESYRKAFAARGHEIDREEYWEYWTCKGEGVAGEIRRHGLPFTEEDERAIFAERRTTYSDFCRAGEIPLIPGMIDSILSLVEAGKACAIASNSFEDDILEILRRAGITAPPLAVVGRKDGLRVKPDPDIFIYSAGVLRKEPAACLVVEDSLKGLKAAEAAGMQCCIIRTPYNQGMTFPSAARVVDGHEIFNRAVAAALKEG